jgi:hypothetical protein
VRALPSRRNWLTSLIPVPAAWQAGCTHPAARPAALAAAGPGGLVCRMNYTQEYGSLELVYAVAAALFAGVVAWKSFGYVAGSLRRRRQDPPPGDSDPRADD